MAAWPNWDVELLGAMGIKPTAARRTFLQAWQRCEGGEADFNPLNTTYSIAGASNYNSAGVKNYADRLEGTAATLLTLRLPYYHELRLALATRGLSAAAILRRSRRSIATWGTNPDCIRRSI